MANAAWKPGRFITVPNKHFILTADLTLGQLKTYLALCDMAGAKRTCWPSYSTLGKRIGQTDRAVKKHIPALEAAGLIRVKRRSTHVNDYTILELPVPPASEPQDTSTSERQFTQTIPSNKPS